MRQRSEAADCEEVNITFLLKQMVGSPPTPAFKIDRVSPKCRTPRRNAEVDGFEAFCMSFLVWANKVSSYFERLRTLHPTRSATPPSSSDIIIPALPLFIKGTSSNPSPSTGSSMVLLHKNPEEPPSPASPVVTAADGNRLLGEESRALGALRGNLTEVFPDDGSIYTWAESFRASILQHCQHVLTQWCEMVDYVELLLRKQLVAAIGKEVQPADFAGDLE